MGMTKERHKATKKVMADFDNTNAEVRVKMPYLYETLTTCIMDYLYSLSAREFYIYDAYQFGYMQIQNLTKKAVGFNRSRYALRRGGIHPNGEAVIADMYLQRVNNTVRYDPYTPMCECQDTYTSQECRCDLCGGETGVSN